MYWKIRPTDAQRLGPIHAAGGQLERLWPYEAAECEWSEDLVLDSAAVTVSGFTASRLESWIEQVTVHGDPDLIKQMRLSAVNEGTVVYGRDRVAGWRRRSAHYPTQLATAVAAASLAPGRLSMWKHWRAT